MFAEPEVDSSEVQEIEITMDDVLKERDRLIAEAQAKLEAERVAFEQVKQQELDEIEQIKQTWQEEQPIRLQEAYDEGFGQGYEDGINKANEAMAESLATANGVITHANENARKYIEDQEQVVLELGLTAAERILNATLERNDEVFVAIIKRGLKEAREMKEIKIYVSPMYYELISESRDELAEMFPTDVPFMIFVNEDIENTECFIETNHGRIVVSIDQQLNELRLKLNEILESKE